MAEEQEIDFSKLSIEDRCQHKNWKARVSGYEELTNLFQTQTDDKSPEFAKYAPLMKKFVIDANAAAQEKGLSAVLAFAENYAHAGKYVDGIISGIVTKCVISPKVRTRELAQEIVLMYVEIEKHDAVIEELIKGLDNKTPKVVTAAASLIRECLRNFGAKVINVKPIVKIILRLLEDKDKNVRDEGKSLAVEVYRWIKDSIKPQLQNLKPVQLQELETGFEKVKSEKATPLKYLRSQQIRETQEVVSDNIDSAPAVAQEEDVAIDPFDLMDPVDILSKLPSDFYELCEAKKWQERKEALDTLQKLIDDNPKLQSGDYSELVRQLKKFVGKDINVVVVAAAAKCLTGIATGLRKSFHSYANSCISVIIEKFKEKKTAVVSALRDAIDAIIVSTSLEANIEDLTHALDNKNPQIKSETALFLVRTFTNTHPSVLGNKKLLKTLCDALMKPLNDMDANVRDASAEAIGTAMKVVGEKTINPFIQGIDALKMTKIKEYCDKAQVKVCAANVPAPVPPSKSNAVKRPATAAPPKAPSSIGSSSRSGSTEDLDAQKKAPPKKVIAKNTVKTQGNGQSRIAMKSADADPKPSASGTLKNKAVPKAKTTRQPLSAGTRSSSKKDDDTVSSAPLLPLNKLKDQRFADEKALKVLKWNFTAPREEFYVQLKEQMITAEWQCYLITYCFHSDFKFHIKAIDTMREFLASGNSDATIANSDLILKWIALRFFDTNPSVILKALEYLMTIFDAFNQQNVTLSDAEANSFIPYLVLKSGDPKDAVRNKVHEIIAKMREIHSPSKIFAHLMTGLQSKNARQRSQCLEEMACLIEICGMSVCQPSTSATVKEIAKFIADRDNGVRNAALNCVVQIYFIEGERVYKYVGQLSDKELSLLEERIKRASKSRIPMNPPQTAPAAIPSTTVNRKTPEKEKNGRARTPSPVRESFIRTTPPKSGSRQRPKSMGPLTLDIDMEEIGHDCASGGVTLSERDKYRSPNEFHINTATFDPRRSEAHVHRLQNDEDIDTLLNLPDIKLRKSLGHSPSGTMTSMINSSQKADVALNLVMAQLSSQDIGAALEALSQLSMLLNDNQNAENALDTKVDQLIIMCYMQYRLFITKHLADESLPKTEAVRLFKGVTNVLMSLFKRESLCKKASRDVLRELMSHMISLLTDPKLTQLNESSFIMRSLNTLATTVISAADATNICSALIKLLHDCMGSINPSPKFTEMVMKCLWKISRNIESCINDMDIDRILFDVHMFLKSFPSSWWRSAERSDTPLRTIKTLSYLIVQHKGESVFNHLTLIPDRNESELYHYLHKALRQKDILPKPDKTPVKSPKVSKDVDMQLASIISKLGTDENALNELYEFKENHPHVDIDTHLERSSDYFKEFVHNGLRKIKNEKEKQRNDERKTPSSSLTNRSEHSRSALPKMPSVETLTPKDVIEWYKSVGAHLGFDTSKFNDPEFCSQMMNGNHLSLSEAESAAQKARDTLENFKLLCAEQKR